MTMKRLFTVLAAMAAASAFASAQTVSELTSDFLTRTDIGAEWKLARRLHMDAGYELRTRGAMSDIADHRASVGLNYKITPGLKAELGYTFIYHHKATAQTWSPRHRVSAALSYTLKAGDWRFGLKEQFRVTRKGDANEYEEPVNALTLKSRFKVSYKGFKSLEPYAFVEGRNLLNAALVNATYSTSSNNWGNYSFGGYGFVEPYFNRVRGAVGAKWKLSKHNAIDFCLMEDYCYERNIDVSKDRTTLKSFTIDPALYTIASVGYKYSF